MESVDTPEFVQRAGVAGFTVADKVKTGKEDSDQSYISLGESSLAKRIVDAVAHGSTGKPLMGTLPKPRRSPLMTLGVAFEKAKVISSVQRYESTRHTSS